MRSRIVLLETANRQANGHIAELLDQLAAAYAEIDRLKELREAVAVEQPEQEKQ